MPDIQILQGSKINKSAPSVDLSKDIPENKINEKEQYQPGLLARLGLTALQGLEAPAKGIGSLLEYFGEPPLIRGNTPSQDIMAKYNISQEQLKPQSTLESIGQRLAELGPISATLGGIPALARTALGSIPSGLLKYHEFPEIAQNLAQLGTELGVGLIKGRIPTTSSEQLSEYKAAKDLVPSGYKFNAKSINNAIHGVREKLTTEVDKTIVTKVEDAIKTIKQNISKNKINPNSSIDLRASINRFRKQVPEHARHLFDDLNKGINSFFSEYSAENPNFYEHLNKADKLTSIKHMGSLISDYAEKLGNYIPNKYKYILRGIGEVLGRGESGLRSLATYPQHYIKIARAAIRENPTAFIKSLDNFKDVAKDLIKNEEEKVINEPIKKEVNFKILRGKKL